MTPDALPIAETERLRILVGPSEVAYEALLADRDAALIAAKEASAEAGALRGAIEELNVQLSRARQDQDLLLRRAAMTPVRRATDRFVRRWKMSVVPRANRLWRRLRPR